MKPKPRRNRSNTIAKANKTIPAETPIIPVTLITRPIMISLSAIADLLAPSYLITSSAGADHESRRSAVGASGTSDRNDSTPRWQETAALRDFNPAHDRCGSQADITRSFGHVRFPTESGHRPTRQMSAKCHVWTAPSWQGFSSRLQVGRCSHVFGLFVRFT